MGVIKRYIVQCDHELKPNEYCPVEFGDSDGDGPGAVGFAARKAGWVVNGSQWYCPNHATIGSEENDLAVSARSAAIEAARAELARTQPSVDDARLDLSLCLRLMQMDPSESMCDVVKTCVASLVNAEVAAAEELIADAKKGSGT